MIKIISTLCFLSMVLNIVIYNYLDKVKEESSNLKSYISRLEASERVRSEYIERLEETISRTEERVLNEAERVREYERRLNSLENGGEEDKAALNLVIDDKYIRGLRAFSK